MLGGGILGRDIRTPPLPFVAMWQRRSARAVAVLSLFTACSESNKAADRTIAVRIGRSLCGCFRFRPWRTVRSARAPSFPAGRLGLGHRLELVAARAHVGVPVGARRVDLQLTLTVGVRTGEPGAGDVLGFIHAGIIPSSVMVEPCHAHWPNPLVPAPPRWGSGGLGQVGRALSSVVFGRDRRVLPGSLAASSGPCHAAVDQARRPSELAHPRPARYRGR